MSNIEAYSDNKQWFQANENGFVSLESTETGTEMFKFAGNLFAYNSNGLYKLLKTKYRAWEMIVTPTMVNDSTSFVVIGQYLYMCLGTQLYTIKMKKEFNLNNWTQFSNFDESGNPIVVKPVCELNGYIYGVEEKDDSYFVIVRCRSKHNSDIYWDVCSEPNFGDEKNLSVAFIIPYKSGVYVGTNTIVDEAAEYYGTGIEIWGSNTGDNDWKQVNTDGFGSIIVASGKTIYVNQLIGAVEVYRDRLYVSTNSKFGAELWRYNGVTWRRIELEEINDMPPTKIPSMYVNNYGDKYELLILQQNNKSFISLFDGDNWYEHIDGPDGSIERIDAKKRCALDDCDEDYVCSPDKKNIYLGNSMIAFKGKLYLATKDSKMQDKVWNLQDKGAYECTDDENYAIGENSVAEGCGTKALVDCSHAEGCNTLSKGIGSHAEGGNSQSIGCFSHAEGFVTMSVGEGSHAEGMGTIASGDESHSEGLFTVAGDENSHAEGYKTKSIGKGAHAEGWNTIARGRDSHAEGYSTKSNGEFSHAEGWDTIANGVNSHAEGKNSIASGESDHAEGKLTIASGGYGAHAEGLETSASSWASHAEGYGGIVSGNYGHAEGYFTEVEGEFSHAEGKQTIASGSSAHSEGDKTSALGYGSHCEGKETISSGYYSHAEGLSTEAVEEGTHTEGWGTKASEVHAHAEGHFTVASGNDAHAEGTYTTASGTNGSHAEGSFTVASGSSAHAEGYETTASGNYAHAQGISTTASGSGSYALGVGTVASQYAQTAMGLYNMQSHSGNDVLIIGNGSKAVKSNAFRFTLDGNAFTALNGGWYSGGADYGEMFEWVDGNPKGEERIGYFVTLEGDKIRIANNKDSFILGVISANSSVVGDAQGNQWKEMYLKDKWGRIQFEIVEVEEIVSRSIEGEDFKHTIMKKIYLPQINPDYNPELEYVSRTERDEWAIVGLSGKLLVRDDGTCKVNGYCMVSKDGVATSSESGFRVLKRVDFDQILIFK